MAKRYNTNTTKFLICVVLSIVVTIVIGIVLDKESSTEVAQSAASVKSDATQYGTDIDVPKIETKTVEEPDMIPFQTVTENDDTLPAGQVNVAVQGVSGEKVIIYKITYQDGDAIKK